MAKHTGVMADSLGCTAPWGLGILAFFVVYRSLQGMVVHRLDKIALHGRRPDDLVGLLLDHIAVVLVENVAADAKVARCRYFCRTWNCVHNIQRVVQHVGDRVVVIHQSDANSMGNRTVAYPAMDGDTADRRDRRSSDDSRHVARASEAGVARYMIESVRTRGGRGHIPTCQAD